MREYSDSYPPSPPPPPGPEEDGKRVVPIIREEASVSRVEEETGASVRVRIETWEERESIPVTDILEEAAVERIPINRLVTERVPPREEGEVLIIPVYETVPVVEMRLLLKEEVRIVRRRREVAREEEVVLRKERAVVERRESDRGEWRQDPPG